MEVTSPKTPTLSKNKSKIISNSEDIKNNLNINKPYFVVTLHRPSNLNDVTLKDIFEAIGNFTNDYKVILPAHPRLRYYIDDNNTELTNVVLIDPLSYIDFMSLVYGCDLVLTDSGGIQEETTYLGINCLTLREETERPITVQEGTNKVIGTDNLLQGRIHLLDVECHFLAQNLNCLLILLN